MINITKTHTMLKQKQSVLKNADETKDEKEAKNKEKYAYDNALLSWEAPEYIKHERGLLWFAIAAIVLFFIVLYSLISGSWSTGVAFVILAGVFYIHHHQQPRDVRVIISEIGIKVGEMEFPYSAIKYFWIVYNPPYVKTLHLALNKRFISEVAIQLENQDPSAVRNYLVQQLPEIAGREESATHLLTRLLKLQ